MKSTLFEGRFKGMAAGSDADREAANRALMKISRALVPLAYTRGDPFRHDLALPIPPLAGLQPVRELATLDPSTDAARFAIAGLVRERNRVVHALREALDTLEEICP
jgi:hypothetical protein